MGRRITPLLGLLMAGYLVAGGLVAACGAAPPAPDRVTDRNPPAVAPPPPHHPAGRSSSQRATARP